MKIKTKNDIEKLKQMKTVIKRFSFLLALFVLPLIAVSQELVTGKVTDVAGEPLIGATIVVKGTTQGAVTDISGNFKIKVNRGETLVCSFIGFKSKEFVFENKREIRIKLEEDTKQIDDVVVVGYGTQVKQVVTGSVTNVDMGKLSESQSSESFETMLQGRIAGVNIQLNSGEPGAAPTVIIRGLASVSREDGSTSDPLYVVDGIPIISRTSDDFSVTSTNVLADLDPNDLADIVVLKDASASAIYGSRAANGVILITTKKGKKGRPEINFNLSCGVNFVPQLQDVAGGVKEREQVARLYELYAPYGYYMPSMYTDVTNPFYNNSSDWQGYLYNTSIMQNYNTSIRGAGDFGQYSVSMGYMDSEGILFNTGFKRYNIMANTSFNALNNALTLNNTLAVSRTDQSKNPDALSTSYSSLLPLPDNSIVEGAEVYSIGYSSSLSDRIRFSTDATVDIFKALSYNARLSLEYVRAMADGYSESRRTLEADESSSVSETRNLLFENTLTYSPSFGDHNIQFLLGQSAEKTESELTEVSNVDDEPTLSETVNEEQSNNIGESDYGASTMLSFFSRINYDYKQKYMLGASIRTDGSSKFGADNRWGIFPSVSAGWNFSKEELFSGLSWLNTGKIRASFGVLILKITITNSQCFTI